MSKQFGFGIVGCGMIAEFHTRAIAEIPNARLVATQSRSKTNAAKIAALVDNEVSTYEGLDEFLAHPGLDVVCICTPSGAHRDPAIQAASAGKHVVVEKPLEITVARCDEIIAACDRHNVKLCTIFPSRYSPANIALKQAIDQGRFGRMILGDTYVKWWRTQEYYDSGGWRGTWNLDGGGALMNQAIHNVDLLQWFMGEVQSVQAMCSTLAHERIEVEDVAVACLRFRNGALGTIEATTAAYPGLTKRIEIHGNKGSAQIDQDDIVLWKFEQPSPTDHELTLSAEKSSGGSSDPRSISYRWHREQLAEFLQSIETERPASIDGREGRKSVEIIQAIYRSSQTGSIVHLPLESEEKDSASA